MIECDAAGLVPGSCVGVEEEAAADIDLYHCPQCAVLRGPSVWKFPRSWGRGALPFFWDLIFGFLSLFLDLILEHSPYFLGSRVTPSLPRQSRPVREGTRVASVETGLAAAAAKLAQLPHFKVPKPFPETPRTPLTPIFPPGTRKTRTGARWGRSRGRAPSRTTSRATVPPSLADHEYTARPGGPGPPSGAQPGRAPTPMAPGVFLSQRRPPPGTAPPRKRPRKGLATAKQRLGRILKIHRNGKLLL
uniref:Uncharacterized protein n=1 Tax=Malurus cyaneus samueli TaxID=2593467 RepID=A0A8C5TPX6_9PASS